MDEKMVCADCVDDYALKAYITKRAVGFECNYCGRSAGSGMEPIAAEFKRVVGFMRSQIEEFYEDSANSVGYDSAEGGWLGPTIDGWDLPDELELGDSNDSFVDDLREEFQGESWAKKNPYDEWESERLTDLWEQFSGQVQHEVRFVFFKLPTRSVGSPAAHQILENIGEKVNGLGLVRALPEGTTITRARLRQDDDNWRPCAKELGPPPKFKASQSRMSPAGIPMFYGAATRVTAFLEVLPKDPAHSHVRVTFGEFKTLRRLLLLDLTSIPPVPSIFDQNSAGAREALRFMRDFEESIGREVAPEDVQYAYVPTQIVAEYFRHVFRYGDSVPIDGIAFRSSKDQSRTGDEGACKSAGICYTLFVDHTQCTDSADEPGKTLLLSSICEATVDAADGTFAPAGSTRGTSSL